ncbi:unnamed protein product, partial [marine sediment metagenome]
ARLTPIYGGISYERLEPFGLQWPCPSKDHPGTIYLHKGKFTKGKGSFMPCVYVAADELPDEEYSFALSTGRVYWHWHTGTMTRRTSTLDREVPTAYIEMNPQDAERLKARDKFEKIWGVDSLVAEPGLTVTEIFNKAREGQVKGLYIIGENPVISDPDSNHVREALENLEFLVVNELFLSDTAQY